MKVKVGKVDTIVYFDLFIYFFFFLLLLLFLKDFHKFWYMFL